MYDKDLIDSVLKSADIVSIIQSYVPVIKKGRNHLALCPFHDDKNPSMNISTDKQIFKCFACGAGGNAITFVQKKERITFEQAVRKVAELSGFHDERLNKQATVRKTNPVLVPLYACINDLMKYYQYCLNIEEGKVAKDYLKTRNITPDMVSKYGIGYAPIDGQKTIEFLLTHGHSKKSIEDIGIATAKDVGMSDSNAGRLIFAIHDENGQVVGFSARRLSQDKTISKYVNSPNTPLFHKNKILYNYHNAKTTAHADGYIYVLEGFMDVMALNKAGINSAVAVMGTALTSEHIEMLRRLNCEIRVCLDGDDAGQMGMMRIINLLNKSRIPFRLVYNPGDLRDPDDVLQEDGPEALKAWMGNLVDQFDFQLGFYQNVKKLETPEDKKKVVRHFIPMIQRTEPGIERDNYIARLSKITGYMPEAIREEIKRMDQADNGETKSNEFKKGSIEIGMSPKAIVKRLDKAERRMLFYMLGHTEAVEYFKDNIDSFHDSTYNELAQYVIEATGDSDKIPDVSSIMSVIASAGSENAEELQGELAKICNETDNPPFEMKQLDDCAKAIEEEIHAIDEEKKNEAVKNATPEEQLSRLIEFTQVRKKQCNRKKKPKEED